MKNTIDSSDRLLGRGFELNLTVFLVRSVSEMKSNVRAAGALEKLQLSSVSALLRLLLGKCHKWKSQGSQIYFCSSCHCVLKLMSPIIYFTCMCE